MTSDCTETFVLLRDWHGGDGNALDRLLERDLPWVRAQVSPRLDDLLRSRGDVDDLVQEAAIQAIRYVPRFLMSDRDQFRALLARITENVLRDNLQRRGIHGRDAGREQAAASGSMLVLDPPGLATTRPGQAAAPGEEGQWVRLAIEFLDADERMLLLWREWEQRSFADIAARLGIREDAARARFTRTLPKLARKVQMLQRGEVG